MKLLPIILLIVLATSCKNKVREQAPEGKGQDSTTVKDSAVTFLPIQALIRQDITRVDSFAGGILRKTSLGGKKDSIFVKPAAFHQAAAAFLIPELETSAFQRSFTENSFLDESTNQLQFIYTPRDANNQLRHVVAYITPTSSGDKVSRFYFEREWRQGDTAIQQKLTWKTGQYFYILTIRQPQGGAPVTQFEKLIWDPEQYGQ